jgi:hypothetical protein
MKRINVVRGVGCRLLLATVTALVPIQTVLAQPPPGNSDARLAAKINYTSDQASVQDIVQNLAQQVGLKYDWEKSFKQTDPLCRRWVRNVAIKDKPCREALDQILKPVGLKYQVENGVIVLERAQPTPSAQARPPGKGYITTGEPPTDLVPAGILSPRQQRENFDFLCKAIDETYADFEIKGIDWGEVHRRYGHTHIVGRLLQKQAVGAIGYVKNGPGHSDLERRDDLLEPAGE